MLIGDGGSTSEESVPPTPRWSGGPTTPPVVSFCPSRCACNITLSNQLQVVCTGHFDNDFPIGTMRKDVEVLKITPGCRSPGEEGPMTFDTEPLRRLRREEFDKVGRSAAGRDLNL